MPAIIIPGRAARGQRPTGPFQFNRGSDQALGLLAWWPMTPAGVIVRDRYLSRSPLTLNNPTGMSWAGHHLGGLALRMDSTANEYASTSAPVTVATQDVTIVCWIDYESLSGGAYDLPFFNGNTSGDGYGLIVNFSGSGGVDLLKGGIGFGFIGGAISTGVQMLALRSIGTTWQIFRNGVPLGGSTTASPNTPTSHTVLSAHDPTNDQQPKRYLDARVYSRGLSDSEVWALYDTPWDLYWVAGRRVFFDIGAAPSVNRRRRVLLSA